MVSDVLVARGIRVAVVLSVTLLVLAVGLHLGPASLLGVFAVTGLLIMGDFRGPPLPRAITLVAVSLGGAVMLTLGALAGHYELTAILGSAVAGFLVLLFGVYRGQFGRAGLPLLLPFLSEAANPEALQTLGVALLAWLVGCAISSAGALLILPGYQRDTAHPFTSRACAAYANLVPQLWPSVTQDAERDYALFTDSLAALDGHWAGNRTRPSGVLARDRALLSVSDYLHRLQTLCATRIQTGVATGSTDPVLATAVTTTAQTVAQSLADGKPQVTLSNLMDVRDRQWARINDAFADAVRTRDPAKAQAVASRNFLLRMTSLFTVGLAVQTDVALGGKPPADAFGVGGVALPEWRSTPLRMVTQQLSPGSPWFRNAARGALALAVAIAIARMPSIEHGFWIVMGALGALRFDALGTGRTVGAAILGQAVGFGASFAIVMLLHPYPWALIALVPVVGFLAGFAPPKRLWMPQAAFTVLVVVCLTLVTPQEQGVPLTRFEDMLIGLGVSLVVSLLLWPRGIQQHVAGKIADAAQAAAHLLVVANNRLVRGTAGSFSAAADRARMSIREASEACDLATLEQPPKPPPTVSWTRLVMSSRHVFFGSVIIGTVPAVPAPLGVAARLDQAALLVGDRFASVEDDVLGMLARHPGSDPEIATRMSRMGDAVRPEVRSLLDEAGTAAVAQASPNDEGVALVGTVEWDTVWLEHVELLSGHLGHRRDRIMESGTSGG